MDEWMEARERNRIDATLNSADEEEAHKDELALCGCSSDAGRKKGMISQICWGKGIGRTLFLLVTME